MGCVLPDPGTRGVDAVRGTGSPLQHGIRPRLSGRCRPAILQGGDSGLAGQSSLWHGGWRIAAPQALGSLLVLFQPGQLAERSLGEAGPGLWR